MKHPFDVDNANFRLDALSIQHGLDVVAIAVIVVIRRYHQQLSSGSECDPLVNECNGDVARIVSLRYGFQFGTDCHFST